MNGTFAVSDWGEVAHLYGGAVDRLTASRRNHVELTQYGGGFSSVAWSPRGDVLAAYHAAEDRIYALKKGKDTAIWTAEVSRGGSLWFSPGGRAVLFDAPLSGGETVIDAATGELRLPELAHNVRVRWPDRSAGWGETESVDAGSSVTLVELDRPALGRPQSVSLSADRRLVLVAERSVLGVYDLTNGDRVVTLAESRPFAFFRSNQGWARRPGLTRRLRALK